MGTLKYKTGGEVVPLGEANDSIQTHPARLVAKADPVYVESASEISIDLPPAKAGDIYLVSISISADNVSTGTSSVTEGFVWASFGWSNTLRVNGAYKVLESDSPGETFTFVGEASTDLEIVGAVLRGVSGISLTVENGGDGYIGYGQNSSTPHYQARVDSGRDYTPSVGEGYVAFLACNDGNGPLVPTSGDPCVSGTRTGLTLITPDTASDTLPPLQIASDRNRGPKYSSEHGSHYVCYRYAIISV